VETSVKATVATGVMGVGGCRRVRRAGSAAMIVVQPTKDETIGNMQPHLPHSTSSLVTILHS
jgi:hypothetical protein